MNESTLRLQHVSKSFGEFVAVSDISLEVGRGRIFGLIGPNGAGKTTTIRMAVGITQPDEGSVELFGRALDAATQDRIGYLPEERGLYKRMKIAEQLRFFGELKGMRAREADASAARWLEKLKLNGWEGKKATELSKGMQQKAQFVAAVMHDPDLLVLDEPFSGLDPVSAELLKGVVLELRDAGKAIILSTHQMEVAEKICDDICLVNRSRKVLSGSIREVKSGFGRNAVLLRARGGEEVLADASLVARVNHHSDEAEVLLAEGADAQELLRRLVAAGAAVARFELAEPSLKDIFIEKVGEGDDDEAA